MAAARRPPTDPFVALDLLTAAVRLAHRPAAFWSAAMRIVFLCLGLLAFAFALAPASRAETATEPLTIVGAKGPVTFEVEVMRNDEDRAKGLMYRRYMPENRGMLFDFQVPQPVFFWMKNTYIPLDMVFIRQDGTIARIAEDTEPLSTRTIASGEDVVAVLELNGGAAQRAGIRAGDKVQHPIFKR
jgi:uncharacterized membrane protein (UPF0127 family)